MLAAVMQSPTPVRVDEIAADPRACGFPPGHPPMHSLIGIPLRLGDKLKGVIYLAEKEKGELFGAHGERLSDTFSEDDEALLSLFGDYLVRALERIELMQALQQSNCLLEKRWGEQQQLNRQLNDAQNQLLQSEKLASIGQLAAGIAHEINNPIGFINSNVGSLERYLKDVFVVLDAYDAAQRAAGAQNPECIAVDALKEQIDFAFLREDIFSLMHETRDGVARVAKIVQDLKDFSHVDEAEWQWADLHKGMESTLNVVWNELKYKAEVVKEYGELPAVECLPFQINQVFMNLLVNAAHAITERGTITLRTGTAGDEVWIEVGDTGSGIAPENLGRIFDPFFTTKPVGKGTGLGLSLSYGIVQKHHGRIEVTSAPGRGTTFRVVLPSRQPQTEAPA
jgi:signal transduction histidine kinase